jgi:hypothetical protein
MKQDDYIVLTIGGFIRWLLSPITSLTQRCRIQADVDELEKLLGDSVYGAQFDDSPIDYEGFKKRFFEDID